MAAHGGEATVDVVDEAEVDDGAGAEGPPALVEVSGRVVPGGRRAQAPTKAPTRATATRARFTAAPGRPVQATTTADSWCLRHRRRRPAPGKLKAGSEQDQPPVDEAEGEPGQDGSSPPSVNMIGVIGVSKRSRVPLESAHGEPSSSGRRGGADPRLCSATARAASAEALTSTPSTA